MKPSNKSSSIINMANQCVQCGLCLPHCPTYGVHGNENESPRGRIALSKALAQEELKSTASLNQYLDHCLLCGACEKVCPAEVPYSKLIIQTRALLKEKTQRSMIPFWLTLLMNYRFLRRLLSSFIFLYQHLRMSFINILPQKKDRLTKHNISSTTTKNRGSVLLFSDCMTQTLEPWVITAAKQLLTHHGFQVQQDPQQQCCGTLHQHHGDMDFANHRATHNKIIFEKYPHSPIVTLASGCQQGLSAYTDNTIDIMTLLTNSFSELTTKPSTIYWHTPCSTINDTAALFATLPSVTLITAPHTCCGAAGLQLLNDPAMANRFVTPFIRTIMKEQPNIVLSSNIGCRLHLRRALRENHCDIPVRHPLEWLWSAIQENTQDNESK